MIHRQPWEVGISIEAAGRFEPPGPGRGIGRRFPDLHRPLRRNQQPAEPGAVALMGGHFLAQGGEAAGAFVAGTCTTGAGQLHHQIGVGLTQLGELVGVESQAAAVDERQGDRPKRLLRAQQPRASRLGGGRRCRSAAMPWCSRPPNTPNCWPTAQRWPQPCSATAVGCGTGSDQPARAELNHGGPWLWRLTRMMLGNPGDPRQLEPGECSQNDINGGAPPRRPLQPPAPSATTGLQSVPIPSIVIAT